MVDAESKTNKGKIRHCYPREEVYHNFIHSPELVYNRSGQLISAKGNYLIKTHKLRDISIGQLEETFGYEKYKVIAIIDRDNKKIIISNKHSCNDYLLYHAIPDDYEIYKCIEEIPRYDILTEENKELLYKTHLTYETIKFVEYNLIPYHNCLNGKLVLHCDIRNLYNRNLGYDGICEFVRKHKIKQYDWYKRILVENHKFETYYPSSYDVRVLPVPTIKQIVTKKVFTNKQIDYLIKRLFYTMFCYGKGVSFTDVEVNWNREITLQEAINFFNRKHLYWSKDYDTTDCHTWNDYIRLYSKIDESYKDKRRERFTIESNKNREAAIQEAAKIRANKYTVEDWKNGASIGYNGNRIKYRHFVPMFHNNRIGKWEDAYVYINDISQFSNTNLKLEGNNVITSRNARVPLKDAIFCWNAFVRFVGESKNSKSFKAQFNNIYVGIYNLRSFEYLTKVTDDGTSLNYMSWRIQIGCHNLWLEEILDFIKYYHLEDKFDVRLFRNPNSEIDNKKKQFKIKLK